MNLIFLILFYIFSTSALADEGFLENFSASILSPKWRIWTWDGTPWTYHFPSEYSLTDHAGYLRFYLGAMAAGGKQPNLSHYWYYPSLQLYRNFTGTCWQLDTKVTYFLPYSNAKSFSFSVCYGEQLKPGWYICIKKSIDQIDEQVKSAHFILIISYKNQETIRHIISKVDLRKIERQTYYFRIYRFKSEFIFQWSLDGDNFETVMRYSMDALLDDADQYIQIGGTSWFTPTGAFADFDYIYVVPISKEIFSSCGSNNFDDFFNGDNFVNNLLYPMSRKIEKIYLDFPFIFSKHSKKEHLKISKKKQQHENYPLTLISTIRIDSLKAELERYNKLAQRTELVTNELLHDYNKSLFLGSRRWIYEKLIILCYQLYRANLNKNYEKKVFQYVEKIKGLGYGQLIAESKAKIWKNLDADLLKLEQKIIDEIEDIEFE